MAAKGRGPPYGESRKGANVIVLVFFVVHWQLSVFFQSFFLHRYGAHKQFRMTKRWERTFHFLTWAVQGASYLSPRAYAILHRMHHAYSDTPKDPHSPVQSKSLFAMMMATLKTYQGLKHRTITPERRFDDGDWPSWPLLDEKLNNWWVSLSWGTAYTLFYMAFATHWWMFLLVPVHYLLGPIHGAIVNWCGHKYGYRNFANGDASRNTMVFDVLTMGELFQNNHHQFGMSPNFAARWFEIDPAYQIMRCLGALRVIDMSSSQVMRYAPPRRILEATTTPIAPIAPPAE
jgi:stearoyl-CoA desaturase (delta-9 desaturase)